MARVSWDPQYENGSLAMLPILVDWDGLGNLLHPEAAAQLRAWDAEFFSVFGKHITTSEAFRDIPKQVYFWNLYQLGQGNIAAYPGTSSHGEAMAIDINSWVYRNSVNSAEHIWMRENAGKYGWSWDLVGRPSGEPWHWNYIFGRRSIVASLELTPIFSEEQELMGALQEIKDHIDATVTGAEKRLMDYLRLKLGRGGKIVYWVKEWGRTYSTSDHLIVNHKNDVEYNIALREAGQEDEKAIQITPFELVRIFKVNGLEEFVPGDQDTLIKAAPLGTVFEPGLQLPVKK